MKIQMNEKSQWCHIFKNGGSISYIQAQCNFWKIISTNRIKNGLKLQKKRFTIKVHIC